MSIGMSSMQAGDGDARQRPMAPSGEFVRQLHRRLATATAGMSFKAVADLTTVHPETVRRYMKATAPSAFFLTQLSMSLGISLDWLLAGREPMWLDDLEEHTLNQADLSLLLRAMANRVETEETRAAPTYRRPDGNPMQSDTGPSMPLNDSREPVDGGQSMSRCSHEVGTTPVRARSILRLDR